MIVSKSFIFLAYFRFKGSVKLIIKTKLYLDNMRAFSQVPSYQLQTLHQIQTNISLPFQSPYQVKSINQTQRQKTSHLTTNPNTLINSSKIQKQELQNKQFSNLQSGILIGNQQITQLRELPNQNNQIKIQSGTSVSIHLQGPDQNSQSIAKCLIKAPYELAIRSSQQQNSKKSQAINHYQELQQIQASHILTNYKSQRLAYHVPIFDTVKIHKKPIFDRSTSRSRDKFQSTKLMSQQSKQLTTPEQLIQQKQPNQQLSFQIQTQKATNKPNQNLQPQWSHITTKNLYKGRKINQTQSYEPIQDNEIKDQKCSILDGILGFSPIPNNQISQIIYSSAFQQPFITNQNLQISIQNKNEISKLKNQSLEKSNHSTYIQSKCHPNNIQNNKQGFKITPKQQKSMYESYFQNKRKIKHLGGKSQRLRNKANNHILVEIQILYGVNIDPVFF